MPFTSLGLGPKITTAVREAGYQEPTPIQSKAIPAILDGRDVVGIAQTGTGKTAAFVLPMLEKLCGTQRRREARALVVTPTRELAVQIEENVRTYARGLDLRFITIYGGVGEQPQIAALRRGVDLIVATPGRLLDLMQQGHVRLNRLEFVVLDEADRMLDIGFLPAIRRIMSAVPAKRQTLLFSATFSREIEGIAKDFLRNPAMVEIGARSRPIETVTQWVHEVSKSEKIDMLIRLLQCDSLDRVLVFSRTRHGADRIARKLTAARITSATIHSSRSQPQRLKALERFKSGEVRVLVATDIAARGIDIDAISHVINFDFPGQPEDYVHRIGRTGRASATGDAISFVTPEDYAVLHRLEKMTGLRLERRTIGGGAAATSALAPVVPIRSTARPAPRRANGSGARRRSRW
ncbi:MAG TPA: DEAD/DEAH box helicase [Thermoanaerobaculia bacterium]|nr:DEAD/DEAH box helicase [Thermoanaerobaculia bacterium]